MNKIKQIFSLDLRSLAILRVGVALLIIFDLIARFGDLAAHYTDQGVVTRNAVQKIAVNFWIIYPHFASGELWFQGLIFMLAGVFAVLLLFGYKTKAATVVSWFLLASLHTRNPAILHGGDLQLRLILFWGIFLPWEKCFSLDVLFRSHSYVTLQRKARELGLRIGLGRTPPEIEIHDTPPLKTLMNSRILEESGRSKSGDTHTWCRRKLKNLLQNCLTFPKNTVFSSATMAYITQMVVMYWMLVLLKSGPEWGLEGSALYHALSSDHLSTPFGSYLLNFPQLLKWLTYSLLILQAVAPILILSPLFTNVLKMSAIFSLAFMHAGTALIFSIGNSPAVAIVALTGLLPSGFWNLASFVWRSPNNILNYTKPSLGDGRPEHIQTNYYPSKIINVLVVLLILYVVLWNISSLPEKRGWLPEKIRFIGYILRLDQTWDSFAPSPSKINGQFVMPGILQNGKKVNTINNMPFIDHGTVAENASYRLKNARWTKYFFINYLRDPNLRPYYGDYACGFWNTNHKTEERLRYFDVYFAQKELSRYSYQVLAPRHIFIWRYYCD